jgi:hypothetical protein
LSKLIMTFSSLLLALAGAACLFMPAELGASFGMEGNKLLQVLIQVTGALYLGFAMANWMGKGLTIGGIYGRPLSMANFTHFFIGAIALLKSVPLGEFTWSTAVLLVYVLLALLFGFLVFFHRSGERQ